MILKQILVFPTWIIIRLFNPLLPIEHKWKNRKFTLKDWANGSTGLNDDFSMLFWISIINILFLIYLF